MSSCKSYLEDARYTWRHNSVLLHISRTLPSLQDSSLYADLPSFPSPSLITGDSLRPDLVLVLKAHFTIVLVKKINAPRKRILRKCNYNGVIHLVRMHEGGKGVKQMRTNAYKGGGLAH